MVEPLLQIPNDLHPNQSRPDLLSSSRCGLPQRQQDLLMKHQKYEQFTLDNEHVLFFSTSYPDISPARYNSRAHTWR